MTNGLDKIAKLIVNNYLRKDKDYHLLVFGGEGSGKSNFVFDLASRVDPNFGVNNVVFSRRGFMELVNKARPGSTVDGDEGANIIAKSDTLKPEQIQVIKKITMMRKLNLFVAFCLSDPNMVHKYYIRHRLAEKGISVVRVLDRGRFMWYSNRNGALSIMRDRLLKVTKDFSWVNIRGKGILGKFSCYEAKHPKFSELYRARNREAITGINIEDGPKGFGKGDVIEMFLINTNLNNYEIAKIVGSASSYVREKSRELQANIKK